MITALVVLCLLVLLQLVLKVALYYRIAHVLDRVEMLLSLTEEHGKLTDSKSERVMDAVKEVKADTVRAASAALEVRQAITAIPEQVTDRLKSSESAESGQLPVVKPESPG